MSNVTPFPKAKPEEAMVWVCQCGCQSFRLQSDGVIECCVCLNTICDHGEWRKQLPGCTEEPERDTTGTTIVSAVGDASLARRRVLKQIEDWSKADELAVLCAYDIEGRGKHWFNIDSEESKAWVLARIQDIVASVEATAISPDKAE